MSWPKGSEPTPADQHQSGDRHQSADPQEPADPAREDPQLEEPAVAAPDLETFDRADAELPPEPAAPELEAPASRINYPKVVRGALSALDRGLSFVLRVKREEPAELETFVEMITPAAELYGPKFSKLIWLIVAAAGFMAFALGKVARRAELSAAVSADGGDGDGRDTTAPIGVRGPARYPRGAGE